MKVKDLRIGNLVYGGFEDNEENSNHSVCLVTGLSEDQHLGEGWNFMLENMGRKDVENYFEMKPIELTEEWLLKFSFENSYRSDYTITMQHETNDKFGIKINNATGISLVYLGIPIRVEFVHQIQNLYFALCGEELELK